MAINFPTNPNNGDVHAGFTYNSTKGVWESIAPSMMPTSDTPPTSPSDGQMWFDTDGGGAFVYYEDTDSAQWVEVIGSAGAAGADGAAGPAGADGSAAVYATVDDLPGTASAGDQAFVTASNRLYLWNGSGWYNIALINTTPSISGADSSYALAIDGTPTVVTITATDPEGIPITYSIASDTSGNIATVTSNNNVFTITPSTNTADAGSFSLTFRASDGVNIATAVSSFTLQFKVENSNYTTALITSVGDNNAVNNSFVDSSTNSHTITAAGNATQTTFSPYRHGGYSTYFDGSGDYLTIADDASIDLSTGDFTLEAWIYLESLSGNQLIIDRYSPGNNGSYQFYYRGTGSSIAFWTVPDGVVAQDPSSSTIKANTWHHVVATRESGTVKIYVDGSQKATGSCSTNFDSALTLAVGGQISTSTNYLNGRVSDVRIVKGTAVYTSAFTPPTERLTAITNTSLLTCHLPYIADGSTNGHSITVNGNTKTESFSPYEYLTYSATDNGGSIYFDGSGDYLSSTITGPGTGDFTYEFWYYPTNSSFSGTAFNTRSSENSGADGFDLNLTSTSIQATYTNVIWLNASTSAIKAFSWNHIALVRNSGTVTIYVNGISVGTASQTSNFSSTSFNLFANVLNGTGLSGNVTDFRYATTAVYTSNFTPPTTPLTAITNTSLLLNGTNAGIIDKSQSVQTLTLSGDVKSSTTQTKYLSSSMYFDGSGDRISFPGNDMVNISSGDFTVEGWVHPTTSAFIKIFTMFTTTNANYAGLTFGISRTTSTTITVECGSPSVGGGAAAVSISSSGTALNNAWSHIAFTREGNTFTLWVNGASEGTATFSGSLYWSPPNVYIGSGNDSAPSYFTGYLSDFRITKGLARYTANFTPPASELKG